MGRSSVGVRGGPSLFSSFSHEFKLLSRGWGQGPYSPSLLTGPRSFVKIYLMCTSFCLHVCMCTTQMPGKSRELRKPGTQSWCLQVTMRALGITIAPLQEQPVLLTLSHLPNPSGILFFNFFLFLTQGFSV